MTVRADISGRIFGMLTVLRRAETRREGKSRYRSFWFVRCSCGTEKQVSLDHLRGGVKSCGCMNSEITKKTFTTHGMTYTATYRSWCHAKARCETPTDAKYYCYGARGIEMCERWSSSFENFFADMGTKPDRLTLERKDVNKGYSPDNCEWATLKKQSRNRTDNVIVKHAGRKMILMDYAILQDVDYKLLHKRISYKGEALKHATMELQRRGHRYNPDYRKSHK